MHMTTAISKGGVRELPPLLKAILSPRVEHYSLHAVHERGRDMVTACHELDPTRGGLVLLDVDLFVLYLLLFEISHSRIAVLAPGTPVDNYRLALHFRPPV